MPSLFALCKSVRTDIEIVLKRKFVKTYFRPLFLKSFPTYLASWYTQDGWCSEDA